jgi:hypothetical protein
MLACLIFEAERFDPPSLVGNVANRQEYLRETRRTEFPERRVHEELEPERSKNSFGMGRNSARAKIWYRGSCPAIRTNAQSSRLLPAPAITAGAEAVGRKTSLAE